MKLKFNINSNVVKSKNNLEIARKYHHYDNVESIHVTANEDVYHIDAVVSVFNHPQKCSLDIKDNQVISYECSCPFNDQDSMCGHLGAVILKLNELEINELPFDYQSDKLQKIKEIEKENQRQRRKAQLRQMASMSTKLIDFNKSQYQTDLRLSINQEKYDLTPNVYLNGDKIVLEYKIGNEKKYVLKNIADFIERIQNQENYKYGKALEFVHSEKSFTDDALKQIDLMKKALIIRRYDMEEYPYYYEPIKRSITIDPRLFDEFYDAYKAQMDYAIALLVNADNAIDMAHAERAPLPFLACMVDDCIKRGKTLEQGGAVYNFTGPQGFGVANMADALYAVKKLVYDENKITMHDLKMALSTNYGKGLSNEDVAEMVSEVASAMKSAGQPVGEKEVAAILKTVVAATESEQVKANGERILKLIDAVPKFGNDIPEVDAFARDVAYTYTKPLEKYKNPRGGMFQAGLYPVSANVPLGGQTGATPDGRLAHMPVADGVSPTAGKDVNGPTAAANSVSRLDHYIASNGTLFNQKFHPSALSGREGLEKFVGLIQSYFDQKGSHMQFNVVSRETLLDAQKHPEQYKHLVVRVAGYSALFTTLSKSLQDDIIRRTEQGF